MLQAGFNLDGDGYYAKSAEGLWVRSYWDKDKGEIRLCWQSRLRMHEGYVIDLDENGESLRETPIHLAKFDETGWVDVEPVCKLDRHSFVGMGKGDLGGLIRGVMCHEARLLALGFGEKATDVASWFEKPEHGEFVLAADYSISNGVGQFDGLDGMTLHVGGYEEEVLIGVVGVAGGPETIPFERIGGQTLMSEFLRSTMPL